MMKSNQYTCHEYQKNRVYADELPEGRVQWLAKWRAKREFERNPSLSVNFLGRAFGVEKKDKIVPQEFVAYDYGFYAKRSRIKMVEHLKKSVPADVFTQMNKADIKVQ